MTTSLWQIHLFTHEVIRLRITRRYGSRTLSEDSDRALPRGISLTHEQRSYVQDSLSSIVARIARRDRSRTEATLQADIRAFILAAGLNLTGDEVVDVNTTVDLEAQVGDGTRRRIDIEVGSTVIEVKKNLTAGNTLVEGRAQLGKYVHRRVEQTGARYLGVFTDGRTWHLYVPDPGGTGELIDAGDPLTVTGGQDADRLTNWLGTVLATVEQVRPTVEQIERHLGADSPSYAADHATLAALFQVGKAKSEVRLKRRLWATLLRTVFGSSFEDDEQLFIDHTLLVITAEVIAHAVIGFDVSRSGPLSPTQLTDGSQFAQAQILGVVEADFFDWPTEVPGGQDFIRSLAHRLSRFDWTNVDHDVLKHLYESVISAKTRKSLGEYYTPDWLAEQMVAAAVEAPLTQRVLDPSCGSGTFLFHAVRRHIAAAEAAGLTAGQAATSVARHVYGMDVHPVAVTLARVTYLLAIGTDRLRADDRGSLSVPVFLGDSLQWEQRRDLFDEHGTVTIHTDDHELAEGGGTILADDLIFPAEVLSDAPRFDSLVREMADRAMDTSGTYDRNLVDPVLNRARITDKDQRAVLTQTFSTMRALHRTGNDHIWSYYVRNLIRPLWLATPENRVDVLVGNPPWLRYSDMTAAMKKRYLSLCRERNLLSGPAGASARDLSTLFVVRSVEMYLRMGGHFSFVMPHGTMTRKPHDGFRSGSWADAHVTFEEPWDLGPSPRATGFPLPSCVVHGEKSKTARRMPRDVDRWTVKANRSDLSWAEVETQTTREAATVYVLSPTDPEPESVYRRPFRAGAIIYPRVLFFVTEVDAGPLGAGAGRAAVTSRRSSKPPWNSVPPLSGTVERAFIHPVHLGETVLPYRTLPAVDAVIPIDPADPSNLLTIAGVGNYPALSSWWATIEETWRANRKAGETADLIDRVDYSSQLTAQLPLGQHHHRVVYTKSGNTLAAARLDQGDRSLIENKLYWGPVDSADEGRYLVGIINSRVMHEAITPMQSLGLFGTRDFDKLVFRVPFDRYNPQDVDHRDIVEITRRSEEIAAGVDLTGAKTFHQARALIRAAVSASGLSAELETAVEKVLPVVSL